LQRLKRQSDGRAKPDLLRQRMRQAACGTWHQSTTAAGEPNSWGHYTRYNCPAGADTCLIEH
jgi:hypothetical protein